MITTLTDPPGALQARAAALVRAEFERARRTRDADEEYSETVSKLRERFEAELAEALERYRQAVRPAHRAYNRAVQEAERAFAEAAAARTLAAAAPEHAVRYPTAC